MNSDDRHGCLSPAYAAGRRIGRQSRPSYRNMVDIHHRTTRKGHSSNAHAEREAYVRLPISFNAYDPNGRLTGTIDSSQSLNRYAYVEGNPVSYLDPLGLEKSIYDKI